MIRKALVYAITVVCLLCQQVKANQPSVSTVKEHIVKHSIEIGVDPALALSIAKSESGFRHEARSRHGAIGVYQLMPSTAKRLGVNPYYLSENIKGGLMYYKSLYEMFGSTELALAAYNAGPGVVKRYKRIPPIGETQRFVSSIMSEYKRLKTTPDNVLVQNHSYSTSAYTHNSAQPKKVVAKTPQGYVRTTFVNQQYVKTTTIVNSVPKKTTQTVAKAKTITPTVKTQSSSTVRKVAPIPIVLPAQGVI